VHYECRPPPDRKGPPRTESNFQINKCKDAKVIHIRLAMVGFAPGCAPVDRETSWPPPIHRSLDAQLRKDPMQYSLLNDSHILCNEKTECMINQSVVDLYDGYSPGNFILVIYDCVNPGKSKRRFVYEIHYEEFCSTHLQLKVRSKLSAAKYKVQNAIITKVIIVSYYRIVEPYVTFRNNIRVLYVQYRKNKVGSRLDTNS